MKREGATPEEAKSLGGFGDVRLADKGNIIKPIRRSSPASSSPIKKKPSQRGLTLII